MKYGRPFSALTEETVESLLKEYRAKPFNISARARALGLKPATLSYHIRGGKSVRGISPTDPRTMIQMAYRLEKKGKRKDAAAWLRKAADMMEGKA
jgi:hypothetical protein